MRILYINALYSPYIEGGAELSLKLIVERMQDRGHEVSVLSLMPGDGFQVDEVDGIRVYRAGLENRYWPFDKQRPGALQRLLWHAKDRYNADMKPVIRRVLELEKPEIVSCHNLVGWSVSVWDELAAQGIPIVQVLHDLYLLCPNSDMFKNEQSCETQCTTCKIFRFSHRNLSAKVSAVVGISRHTLERFEHFGYFPNATKAVIRNARLVEARPRPEAGASLRLGYLGTLAKKKGVEWLLNQFVSLTIDATLHVAGKGQPDYETTLKSSVKDDRIFFEGYVDPADFFSRIDVLVVPSIWQEPLGMVAVEALAHHIPVIASRVGGLQETIEDGVNGILVNPEEPESLARAITRLAMDKEFYQALSSDARASIAPLLSTERMVGEYEALLKGVLSGKEALAVRH